jgi:GNAT superfamily N-acetyltransferase
MGDLASFSIETGSPRDAVELAAHVNAGYRGDSSRAGWTTEADLVSGTRTDAAQLIEEMAKPGSRFEIIRDEEGKILASVHLVREKETTYLGMLTVRPTKQGGGIGKVLLAHSEKIAREWGASKIRMTVIDRRAELIAYYERRGYSRTGVLLPFHFDDPRFGVAKVELWLVELAKKL